MSMETDLLKKLYTVLNSIQSAVSPIRSVKSNTDNITATNTALDLVNTNLGLAYTQQEKAAGYTESNQTTLESIDTDIKAVQPRKIDQTTNGTTNKVTAQFIDEGGTPYGVKHISNKPRVSAMPYLYDIAEGNVTGHEAWSKIGYNGDVDATTEDMIAQGGVYVFPEAEGSMDIVSSSAEDDPDKGGAVAGTGIHTVTLYYLDDEFTEKSVDIDLNGTVAVETSVSDIYRVQNLRAKVCGTGGKAAGNITLSEHGGTTYKYGYIALGQTRQRQCVYTVPKLKTLYITSIGFSIGGTTKEKAATFTTMAKYDNKAAAIRDFFFPYTEITLEDSAHHRDLEMPTKLPAGVDLKVQVKGLVADCICSCTLRGWLET